MRRDSKTAEWKYGKISEYRSFLKEGEPPLHKGKIAFVGGDDRAGGCAEALYRHGYEPVLYGFGKLPDTSGATRCTGLSECLYSASAVILPFPVSKDGKRLYGTAEELHLSEVFEKIPKGVPVFGGKVSAEVQSAASAQGLAVTDLAGSETFLLNSAAATAEGAVFLAMQNGKKMLGGSKALITGCGRIAEALALRLRGLLCDVTVCARRAEARTKAALSGFMTCDMASLPSALGGMDFVFNTVPARIFDAGVLESFSPKVQYIELASAPYGMDGTEAEKRGIHVTDGSFLPARYCPESAGEHMAEELLAYLEEKGTRKNIKHEDTALEGKDRL